MPKFAAAVVDAVIPAVEGNRVVDFVVGESFKAAEECAGIRMVLLGVGSVAAAVGAAIEATPVVAADNEDVEVDLEVVGIALAANVLALATNVLIFKKITERVISAEDVFKVVRVDVLAARTDSVLIFESIVRWLAVACTRASFVIDFAIVASNEGVGTSIAIVDDTADLTGVAVAVCEAGTVIEISVN